MISNLSDVVYINKDECKNCHVCISKCPVKYCNDGSGDYIKLNSNLCLGCGQCIKFCTHKARKIVDDTHSFLSHISQMNMVAIVAPGVASNFPNQYLRLNRWLKSIGISAVFDVSFGGELTIRSYMEHMEKNNPKMIIAQPCPAIVTYIEIYRPELLPYLAPVDSPMVHTIKMIKEFYPQYRDYKVAVMSPCIAKKREFEAVGLDTYNVTFHNLKKYFEDNKISLDSYEELDYDNPPAERAVLFPSPGGLLLTAERWNPDIRNLTRKIEGPQTIYEYLDHLAKDIADEKQTPLLIDCLNCEAGCNGGTGTDCHTKSADELENLVKERRSKIQKKLLETHFNTVPISYEMRNLVNKYWKPGLYERKYLSRNPNLNLLPITEEERKDIFINMGKLTEADIYNCSSCGYGNCEHMAVAIHNGLNKPENCHHYLIGEIQKSLKERSILATAIEQAGECIVITDNNGNIRYVNPAFEHITGYKKENVLGKNPRVLQSGKHTKEFYKYLWNTALSGNIWRGHFTNKKKDGTFYEEEATISPVKDKIGHLTGYVAVKRDVTEQMKQEEYLRQTQKLQAIVTLTEGIAHNFNNIIVGIMGYLQVSIYEAPKGSKLQTNLERIQKSCKRAMDLVKQFMCFSRKGSNRKKPVQIGPLIKEILQFIKDILPDTIEIKENIKEKAGLVIADKTQIEDVMINLCNNATYAMKENGGTLEVTLTDLYIDSQSLYSEFAPGHYIRLTVKDTGDGMDKKVIERIFDPFFTTKKEGEGSGMGLAIVHGIVKGHNGEILVESEVGKGSSFHIFLPIIKSKEEKEASVLQS